MACSSASEAKNYGLLKDLRVESKVSDERSLCFSFWLYLTRAGPFPAIILYQEDPDTGVTLPFLVVNQAREMMLYPIPYLHKQAFANLNSLLEVSCLSISAYFPLEKWVHFGCQASPSFLRLHMNGEMVREKCFTNVHSDGASTDLTNKRFLPCIVGNKNGCQGYVYSPEFFNSTVATVRSLYLKDPPLQLSIDKSSARHIDDEVNGLWYIVGGKGSCRKKFSLNVLLLDAFGYPVDKAVEVVASLLYADSHEPVRVTSDGEAPLLVVLDGTEHASFDKPSLLVDGTASFVLKISQLSSKCDNRLFHIRFQVPALGRYPFLEAFTLPIRCISRTRTPRTTPAARRKFTPKVHYVCRSRLDSGSSEILHEVVHEAKPSASSKRVKMGNHNPVYPLNASLVHEAEPSSSSKQVNDNPVCPLNTSLTLKRADQECISETYITKKVGNVDEPRLQRHARSDNFSSGSETSEITRSDVRFTPPKTNKLSDELAFKYCFASTSERLLLLKEIAMSVREEELLDFAERVSLFSGCAQLMRPIKIAKGLITKGIEAWNSMSCGTGSKYVAWETVVTWMNEYFMKITCSDRSLTQQDMEIVWKISGCLGLVSEEDFERMWFWLYPVAFTLAQKGMNFLWSSESTRWIEGFITRVEAESSLQGPGGVEDPGTFLLRFSTTRSWPHPDAGSLIITHVGSDRVIHHNLLSLECISSSMSEKGLEHMLINGPDLTKLGRVRRAQ